MPLFGKYWEDHSGSGVISDDKDYNKELVNLQ